MLCIRLTLADFSPLRRFHRPSALRVRSRYMRRVGTSLLRLLDLFFRYPGEAEVCVGHFVGENGAEEKPGRQLTTMMAVTLLREPRRMGVSEKVRPSCQENSGRRMTRVNVCSVERHSPRVRVFLKSLSRGCAPPSSSYTCAVVFSSRAMDKRMLSSVHVQRAHHIRHRQT